MSTENTNPAPEETAAELTIQDLVAVKSIIDVASQRGAFKPNEMVAVGTVYSKLEKFLMLAQKQSQPAAQQTSTAPTEQDANA
jgi:hypothetical protein